ncbi:MAG: hypothetical protein BWX79_01796 [Alphaproteobacteria bacterium ADurb.Bin100]|nr:MAG: hypothetical protein BWX79_01796 [Alphaproteobacteria bacterium ADurb.Bin100]
MEVVHIGGAVGVDARQQGDGVGEFGEVIPVDQDARAAGDGHQVQRVVGRAARGQQADDAVDDGLLIHDVGQGKGRRAIKAHPGDGAAHRLGRQCLAQRCAGIDEGRARQLQAHDLQQHLVGVGGAVEGAGAGAVVGLGLGLQQGLAAHQALRVLLAHLGLAVVRQARGHGPGGHEDARQVGELQGPHQQAGHDLVAHAQKQRGVEHVVRQRHGGGQGNHVAREQRQFHAGRALGDAVAHRGHAAGDLGRGAQGPCGGLDRFGVVLVGLVRREHVVVGADDAHMGGARFAHLQLVVGGQGSKGVRHVGAAHAGALAGPAPALGLHTGQPGLARGLAALGDAVRDARDAGIHGWGCLGGSRRTAGRRRRRVKEGTGGPVTDDTAPARPAAWRLTCASCRARSWSRSRGPCRRSWRWSR